MIDAVKNINTDIRSNLGGFKTQLDADGYNQQKQVAEFIKKVNSKKEIDTEKQNKVDYKKFESEVKNFLKDNNLAIEFSIDDNTKKMVMKLIDEDTKEIVKQFPSEISLHIARILSSSLEAGNITNVKVWCEIFFKYFARKWKIINQIKKLKFFNIMDDILFQMEEQNKRIEKLLNSSNVLDSKEIDDIQLFYSNKKSLMDKFFDYRKSEKGNNEFKSKPEYWNKRFEDYLNFDKSIMNKLAQKVKLHAESIKDNSSKKKLLIYSRV